MQKIQLTNDFSLSRLIHGHWRILDWNMSDRELLEMTEQTLELGITSYDTADIYGNYECESRFGKALRLKKSLRKKIEIITKCGIKMLSDKHPERTVGHYDYSYDHIVASAEQSLKNLGTDYIDLLLLHRPSPFFNPEEAARAFRHLKESGKVLHFGVSNFNIQQFKTLNAFTDEQLVTNQVEISPYCIEHFENDNIEFFLRKNIKPMAWSPLAGGSILHPTNDKGRRVCKEIRAVREELGVDSKDKIVYAWLLKHPANIMPVLGTGKIDRIRSAVASLDIDMSLQQWFRIFIASRGEPMP
jgi:predicted oxidoreductase